MMDLRLELLVVVVLLLGVVTGEVCNPPYEDVGGYCFYINTDTPATWQEARDLCRSLGGDGIVSDLAIFPTCDAFTNFAGHLGFTATSNSTFWVGAHTEFSPNNWRWLDGEPLATGVPYWAYVEGHDNGEECAAMDGKANFQLADFDCNVPRFSICSMPMMRQDHTRDDDDDDHTYDCPSESVEVGDYCYWFSSYKKSWWDAEDYCRSHFSSHYGELFAPSSCDEFTSMAHHLEVAERDKKHWVGASDVSGYQEWFWVNGDPVPGGPPFWASDSPSDHSPSYGDYCALMSNTKRFYLHDERCTNMNYFICKVQAVQ